MSIKEKNTKDPEGKAHSSRSLQESENLLRTVFDTSNHAIALLKVLYNEDGSIRDFLYLKVNKLFREMSGRNSEGQTYLATTKNGEELGTFDSLKNVVITGQPLDQEFYFDKEGYQNWFRLTARAHDNLIVAAIEDITERKKEAEQLKESLRFKRELAQASTEVIFIINLSRFNISFISKDVFPEVGMTKEKIQEMPLQQIMTYINPRDREKVIELHKKLLKTTHDQVHEAEVRVRTREGTWAWFKVRGKIFQRRDANWVEEYVLLVTDITDQKKTEKALLRAQKLSIQGDVARTLAHELRNPIASIGMVGQTLEKQFDKPLKERFGRFLDILSRSTSTLNELVSELLNSANYTPSKLKETNLAEVVEETLKRAADRLYLSGVEVEKAYCGDYKVMADKEKLTIALLNLVVNASEATEPGKGKIKIEIAPHDHDYMLCISDNGHGIEDDQIERLFEAFYTSKSMGVGVGLSSVKDILEQHDAQIRVISKPGDGTTFNLSFPIAGRSRAT